MPGEIQNPNGLEHDIQADEPENQLPYMGEAFDSIFGFFKSFAVHLFKQTESVEYESIKFEDDRPLFIGRHEQNINALKPIRAAELDINPDSGTTALHRATSSVTIILLLAAGADVHARDNDGNTPLHNAKSAEAVKVLIEAGADVHARDNDGNTPLHNAKSAEAVKVLIEAGADVHARNNNGSTPILTAITHDAMKALLAAGADINARNNSGQSILHSYRSPKTLKMLIDKGAQVDVADNIENYNPLSFYVSLDRFEQAKMLIEAGANTQMRDYMGRTAIDFANIRATEDIKNLLRQQRTFKIP